MELYDQGTVEGDQAPDSWSPVIAHYSTGTPEVHAIHVDVGAGGGGSDLVYLGGQLRGTDTGLSVTVDGLVLCDAPGTGSGAVDGAFDLGLGSTDRVRALALNSSGDFCLAGSFWIGGQTRTAVCFDGTSILFTVRGSPGTELTGMAIAVDGNDNVIVGGSFHFVEVGSAPYPQRKGVAAFDSSGNLLNWAPDVLEGQAGEQIVRVLHFDTTRNSPDGVIWIGGNYTGGTALSWSNDGKDIGFFLVP